MLTKDAAFGDAGGVLSTGTQLALQALSAFYDTIEFRSALTPPMQFRVADLSSDSPPSPVTQWLRPTLVLTGTAGTSVVAPMGEAPPSGALAGFGVIGAVMGVGAIIGFIARGKARAK